MSIRIVPRALAALGACFQLGAATAQDGGLSLVSQLRLDRPTEIVAFDAATGVLLVTLGGSAELALIDVGDVSRPREIGRLDLSDIGGGVNSVACFDGLCAVAITAHTSTDPGWVVVLTPDGSRRAVVAVGSMPDMLCFTPSGDAILVANEGEPSSDGAIDPPGSVSVIDTATFAVHEIPLGSSDPDAEVDWFTSPERTPAAMIEPEYIAVSQSGERAYVVCQENNAIAEIEIASRRLVAWHPVGVRPHRSGLDALCQPDAIVAIETPRGMRLVTANEGDPRDRWGTDGVAKRNKVEIAASSLADGRSPTRFGSESLTLFDDRLRILDDTGNRISDELIAMTDRGQLGERAGAIIERRSRKRGVEPEGLATFREGAAIHIYAGLERAGMIAHFVLSPDDRLDLVGLVTIPSPEPDGPLIAPEGLLVIPPEAGRRDRPILVVTDETHGTLSFFEIAGD